MLVNLLEAKTPARVTRNSSRRCAASTEVRAAEVPVAEPNSVHKKANKRVTFSPVSANGEVSGADCVKDGEKQAQIESNHTKAAVVRQDIACSYSHELQLECLSFKETLQNDYVNDERGLLKKPRIDAAASPSVSRKLEPDMLLATPSPTKVKEEPLDFPLVIQKRDAARSPAPLPASMSTRQHEKQIVVYNKDSANKFRHNESEDTLIKEKPRRKVALLGHIEKSSQSKKENDSLQSIAAAYGSTSDDDSGAIEKIASMQLVQNTVHAKNTRASIAEGKRAVSHNNLTLRGSETSSKLAVTVKEEPACTLYSNGHPDTHSPNCEDISRGQELVPISVSNTLTCESLPPFYYIKNSITFQNAYVNFALARIGEEDCCAKCVGNCLERYPPCHCARESGGEFAYDLEGRLRQSLLREAIADKRNTESSSARNKYCDKGLCFLNSEQCKGHLIRKFVKECWSKCGCDMQCGNRVVQRGICRKLQVSYISKGKGWGLHTLEDLPPGTFICEYVGEILTNVELDTRNKAGDGHSDHYPTLLDADLNSETMLRDEELLCLDATYYGNIARFINHRCYDANLVDIPVEIESPDHHYYHIAFFTTRPVKALEELTWDYCIDFEDVMHPVKAFNCLCDSQYCRGRHYRP
ncbi:hypothetical protein GOP47_0009783 [Adiantum capillus-veneris]|uniref:Histone-lysine N-methyltransferase SUVR4 n=1 Tax=Adiantum capillus-veneris TaxID=13818 RepID=A0A9D4UXR7_ADICA|nr:hypothetical protein GOP47_0009783 [Adiantum capillus-veneris]